VRQSNGGLKPRGVATNSGGLKKPKPRSGGAPKSKNCAPGGGPNKTHAAATSAPAGAATRSSRRCSLRHLQNPKRGVIDD